MAASARMSTHWALRMTLVSTAFAAFAVWCLIDAKVGYPRFNQRAAEYNRLRAAGQSDDWPALAAAKGWRAAFSEADHLPNGDIGRKTEWDIGTQYVMMAGCLAVVAVVVYRVLRARHRTMRADEGGFVTVEGVPVPYADITGIDLSRWQSKSIVRVRFRRQGRELTTEIDDWIYQGGEAILAELQARTGLGLPSGPQGGALAAAPTVDAPPSLAGDTRSTDGEPNDRAS